ncbi:MAG: hypothetical protein PHH61_02845 [Candidatus Nanoarchaeia archaeon]|nr:hypothetical protein [Candidatus Nanoarchaeia archaeon]
MNAAEALEYNISAPDWVAAGEWFAVTVTASSDESVTFDAYSYVYQGFNCVGQGWIANKKEISLAAGETKTFSLDDLVKFGTEAGLYNLRVRFKFNESSNITETFSVKVLEGDAGMPFKEIYLYIGLIAVCAIGVFLAFKFNR